MTNSKSLFDLLSLDKEIRTCLDKNKKVAERMEKLLTESKYLRSGSKIPEDQSKLLYTFAKKGYKSDSAEIHSFVVRDLIIDQKITSQEQLDAAEKYFSKNSKIDFDDFEKNCGIGVTITDDEIRYCVREILEENIELLKNQKWDIYPKLRSGLMKNLRNKLPWADGKKRLEIFNSEVEAIIGPKPKISVKKKSPSKINSEEEQVKGAIGLDKYLKGRKMSIVYNTKEIYAEHVERTKGVFHSRFPPEPNGYLHIGHAKAINFDFSLAKAKNGECILRFDDTNPLAEDIDYIENIIDNVKWLGFEPSRVTYSSDYFDELFAFAVKMIKDGNAYVCHQPQEEIKRSRDLRIKTGKPQPSPFRDRPVKESLRLFYEMRDGKFEPGEATLRMKGDLEHPNPNMWDHIAYRIIDATHPHVGNKWRVYPSYDFTHCIVDSLEDIDASCCTLEFENRRESYFWLLDKLGLFKPVVWEFSRLNMDHNVMSKRMLSELVDRKIVRGWDDPRLLTINGIRRKGVPAEAINNFCEKIGVTRAQNSISSTYLDVFTINVLDSICKRNMAVLDPLKIIITDFDQNETKTVLCPLYPNIKNNEEKYVVTMRKTLFIEKTDFKLKDEKKFFGLAPGKTIRLKYGVRIRCDKVVYNNDKTISHLECSVAEDDGPNPKGVLHWVSPTDIKKNTVEVRLYENLFSAKKPGSGKKSWLEEINKNSETKRKAVVTDYLLQNLKCWKGKPYDLRYQFERIGFFCKDEDSTDDKIVLNRIVSLRTRKVYK